MNHNMIKPITKVKVSGKRVLVRAGFDVQLELHPHSQEPKIVDSTRIKDILPTLKYLMEQKSKIVIVSHLGRPEGWDTSKSMWPVAEELARMINYKVIKVEDKLPEYSVPHLYFLTSDITKNDYSAMTKKLKSADILFLENVRFYAGEEKNDANFIKTLASYGDVYVNDAFSAAHRDEASTYGVAEHLPHYAGVSLEKEIKSLDKVMRTPHQPFVMIMGGVKVTDKAETIRHLARHAKYILVGGALGDSFLKAAGYETGKSTVADVALAKELLRNFKSKLVLPVDVVVAKSPKDHARAVDVSKIRSNETIYDIGPKTILKFAQYIKSAKTLVWNGPMGLIEEKRFATGSAALAMVFASKSRGSAYGVIGGGETISVIDKAHVAEFIDHISTGGGAMLEYLAGKKLPALTALEK